MNAYKQTQNSEMPRNSWRNRFVRLNYLCLSPLALYLASNICLADEAPKQANTSDKLVTFEGYGLPFDWQSIPEGLASAIGDHPDAKKFRTDWSYSEGGGSGIGAVLYDRKSKTLKYFERDSDDLGVSTFLYTYSEVTDKEIQQLRADLNNESKRREISPAKSGLDALLNYGCSRTGGWRYRSWDAKFTETGK